jgi:hypothetical protein
MIKKCIDSMQKIKQGGKLTFGFILIFIKSLSSIGHPNMKKK